MLAVPYSGIFAINDVRMCYELNPDFPTVEVFLANIDSAEYQSLAPTFEAISESDKEIDYICTVYDLDSQPGVVDLEKCQEQELNVNTI